MLEICMLCRRAVLRRSEGTEQVRDNQKTSQKTSTVKWKVEDVWKSIIRKVLHLRVGSVQRSGDEARHTRFYIDSNSAFLIDNMVIQITVSCIDDWWRSNRKKLPQSDSRQFSMVKWIGMLYIPCRRCCCEVVITVWYESCGLMSVKEFRAFRILHCHVS